MMGTVLGREPVLIFGVVQAAILLATTFGFRLEAEQIAAIQLFALAVLSFIVRGKVTPA